MHDIGIDLADGRPRGAPMRHTGFNPFGSEYKIFRKGQSPTTSEVAGSHRHGHETMILAPDCPPTRDSTRNRRRAGYWGDKIKTIFYHIADSASTSPNSQVFARTGLSHWEMKQSAPARKAGHGIGGLGACDP